MTFPCRAIAAGLPWAVVLLLAAPGPARTQAMVARGPSTGYVYPAGGRQGTVVEVLVGGQNLQSARQAYVSGTGVEARVVQVIPPLNIDQQKELANRLAALARQKLGPGQRPRGQSILQILNNLPLDATTSQPPTAKARAGANTTGKPAAAASATPAGPSPAVAGATPTTPGQPVKKGKNPNKPVVLPDHPYLRNLEEKSLAELREVANMLLRRRSKQPTPPAIAMTAVLEVTIAADAPPGDRELRLYGPAGMTDPLRFQVATAPEVLEHEPNDPNGPPPAAVSVPVTFNGQVMPGDVDCFTFHARQGQRLVLQVAARRLMPYLADAVPGWFQAVVTIRDEQGKTVAYNDDFRFNPDPVLLWQVPADGDYVLEVRDSIYRGREDFVYRVSVGEEPFVTQLFPLGGRVGQPVTAAVSGWNVPAKQVQLDTSAGPLVREAEWRWPGGLSNPVHYAVDSLAEGTEQEPNDTPAKAQAVTLPVVVNGRIGEKGDADVYRFPGQAGQTVVAEVYARRLDSPLDSLVRLLDDTGKVVAWNDDHPDKAMGLVTHQADSYVSAKLPKAGTYYVQVTDTQGQGGGPYAYRLRLSPPQPDFELRVTPCGLATAGGLAAPICVYAFRKDGFDGDIEVSLVEPPAGWSLSGGLIPRGRESVWMTISATSRTGGPVSLQLQGQATVGGATVSRPVLPAYSMMQAFAYWHLVPAQEFLVAVAGRGQAPPPITLADSGPLRIPVGGSAEVHINVPPRRGQAQLITELQATLREPPPGLSAGELRPTAEGAVLTIKADRTAKAGTADNLIVELTAPVPARRPGMAAARPAPAAPASQAATAAAAPKPAPAAGRRVSLGVLPAIPFQIVQQ